MGLIHIDLFTTLDGVAQAPGGPEEDTDGGFTFGGWQAPLIDEVVGEQVDSGMAGMDALLLGRRTYDIFAAYWPHEDGGIARLFNRIPKYVASRRPQALEWAGSTQLGADVATAVRELRARHANIHVIGSLDFVQTLFAERFFDRLTLGCTRSSSAVERRPSPTGQFRPISGCSSRSSPRHRAWRCSATRSPTGRPTSAICRRSSRS